MRDLLADVVRATAAAHEAPSSADLLDRVARLVLRHADWVIADRLDDPDLITRVAAYDGDGPLALVRGMGAAQARRSTAGSVGLVTALLASPYRVLRLSRTELEALAAGDDPHRALQAGAALELGTQELLVLGLVSRGALLGVLTLGRTSPVADDVLDELGAVAAHVGLALEAARLLTVQRDVATAMQNSLLPPLPVVAGLGLAARYTPAARGLDVGGDWYDAFPTPAGLVVVVGDASGHDVAAAARMADLRNLLRAHAVDRGEGPAELLARVDRSAAALGLDATATCIAGRLVRSSSGWTLTWSSAGHLPPVLRRHGRAQLLETPADLMLGVDPTTDRADQLLELRPGDLLVLCSDGLVEVRDQPLEDRLELLRRTVEEHGAGHPDLVADQLLTALAAGGGDDVVVLVLAVG